MKLLRTTFYTILALCTINIMANDNKNSLQKKFFVSLSDAGKAYNNSFLYRIVSLSEELSTGLKQVLIEDEKFFTKSLVKHKCEIKKENGLSYIFLEDKKIFTGHNIHSLKMVSNNGCFLATKGNKLQLPIFMKMSQEDIYECAMTKLYYIKQGKVSPVIFPDNFNIRKILFDKSGKFVAIQAEFFRFSDKGISANVEYLNAYYLFDIEKEKLYPFYFINIVSDEMSAQMMLIENVSNTQQLMIKVSSSNDSGKKSFLFFVRKISTLKDISF